ncbi:MAG: glutathione S-transferase family protein [Paracoccaceae bacterium]
MQDGAETRGGTRGETGSGAMPGLATLYDQPRAPNPRRLNIALAEKGVAVERVVLDLMKNEHRSPEVLARTGHPAVPALVLDDGTVLTETVAILRYVEALHPEPNLLGRDVLEQATIEMWQRRVEFGLFAAVAACFRHTNRHLAVLEDQVPEWGEINRRRIRGHLEALDARLGNRDWIAADRLTVADITAIVALDFLRIVKEAEPDDLPGLTAWAARMRARPSWRAGMEAET